LNQTAPRFVTQELDRNQCIQFSTLRLSEMLFVL